MTSPCGCGPDYLRPDCTLHSAAAARDRNIYWAERFEEEAAALERGPNEPCHPVLLKASIDSCRAMAADLRKQVADAEKTPS